MRDVNRWRKEGGRGLMKTCSLVVSQSPLYPWERGERVGEGRREGRMQRGLMKKRHKKRMEDSVTRWREGEERKLKCRALPLKYHTHFSFCFSLGFCLFL